MSREIDADTATALLPMGPLVERLSRAFVAGCEVPPRHHHTIGVPGEPDATLLLMPSWRSAGETAYLGVKLVTVFPGNTARGLPGLNSIYLLFDGRTGRQLATIDGNVVTSRRTAAVSALAASRLAREDASQLLVLGSGRVASLLPEAYRAVRPIRRVGVWDVDPDGASRLVARLGAQGIEASVVDDLEEAIGSADVISSATLATAPLIAGAWLKPGVHVDLIGSFTPGMREADDEAVRRSAVYVDTPTALEESGDLLRPIAAGVLRAENIGHLSTICAGAPPARVSSDQITLFKAVGTALADLAAASMAYEKDSNAAAA